MGSKAKIAKHIVPIIQNIINTDKNLGYFEPFAGGMNIIDKIQCQQRVAFDINKYLIALFVYLQSGGVLPNDITYKDYCHVRDNIARNMYPDWYVGCAGFLASYNGRFFDGGYAKEGDEITPNGIRHRNYYHEAKANILKQIQNLKSVAFGCYSYEAIVPSNCVIYCDPPYAGTKQYANSKKFDHDVFWNKMREWRQKGNIILISEQQAPDDFVCIWEHDVSRTINAKNKTSATEKLFVFREN